MIQRKKVVECFGIGMLVYIFLFTGCAMKLTPLSEISCQEGVPLDVQEFFESGRHGKTKGFIDRKEVRSIVEGTHEDLFMPKIGKVKSKSKKWTTNVKFEPFLYYENDGYVLLKICSEYRLANFTYMHLVLRKSDGKIIRRLKTELSIVDRMMLDDIFYFKIIGAGDTIYCMKIGE